MFVLKIRPGYPGEEANAHLFLREPNTLWGGSVTKDRKLRASKEEGHFKVKLIDN